MTLRVQGEITINGAQAKTEARAVGGELKKLAGDATGLASAERRAGEGAAAFAGSAGQAERAARNLAAAERAAANEAVLLGQKSHIAAGQIGTITAQFNDIGVMMAAGQNPFQLAIQQGTQLTQVLGPMGARGAVTALTQGFMAMWSPINLITIGSIAAGAALVQWLGEGEEQAATFDDALDALADQTDAYIEANKRAVASVADLRKEFGDAADAAHELLLKEAEIARARAGRSAQGASAQLQRDMGVFLDDSAFATGNQVSLAQMFDLSIWSGEARTAINEVLGAFRQLDTARGIDAQIAALNRLKVGFEAAAQASGEISVDEESALSSINKLILGLQKLKAEEIAAQRAMAEANGRFPGFEAAQAAADARLAEEVAIRQANAAAQDMIATLQTEEVIHNRILLFGQQSDIVAQSRLAAEREILAAELQTEGVTAEVAARVLEAWDAAKGFKAEAAGLPGLLSAAAGAAAGIAGNLWNAVKAQVALKQEQATQAFYAFQGDDERGSQRDGVISAGTWKAEQALERKRREVSEYRLKQLGIESKGGGGGAKKTKDEADAVKDLIEKLKGELDITREMDPVQREMLRYRDELKGATAAEREEVEKLITQREREKAVTEGLKFVGETTGDALIDGLMGAADAGERLIETLKRAVLQALLLGEGPLAGMFGTAGGGGLLGLIFPSAMASAATPSKVLSAAPSLGAVSASQPAKLPSFSQPTIGTVNIDARGATDPEAVRQAAKVGMAEALSHYRRTELPLDIRRSVDQPRVTRW